MKKFLVFLLSLTICLTPTIVFSGAAEKWEIVENVYDTSKNVVNVTAKKVTQQASNSGVYKVQVPVSASALGKTVKTMMWTGIAVAGVQAMLEGIGWIIDTGSKTIKRPKVKDPSTDPNLQYVWVDIKGKFHSTARSAADVTIAGLVADVDTRSYSFKYSTYPFNGSMDQASIVYSANHNNNSEFPVNVTRTPNPNYDPSQTPEPEYEYLSDSDLGNEITGKGENKVPLPKAVADAYSPNNPVGESEPAPKATNDALNNANPQPEKEPEGKSETEKEKDENGQETGKETTKFELPKFCEWAPAVCDFFTVQKQDNKEIKENQKLDTEQNKTFFEKVSDYFDWTKKEPEKDNSDNDLPIKTPDPFDTSIFSKDRFSVSRQCPVPEQQTISLSGISVNFAFDLKPICSVLELARPALIACSYLYACYIVIGAARNG